MKNIILMYFQAKNTLKNNNYHNINRGSAWPMLHKQKLHLPCKIIHLSYILRGSKIIHLQTKLTLVFFYEDQKLNSLSLSSFSSLSLSFPFSYYQAMSSS